MQDVAAPALHQQISFYERVQGIWYPEFLVKLHEHMNPDTYFEIGTQTGGSLRIAKCRSIAVDPGFVINTDVIGAKPACHLYQTTSDKFFRHYDPSAIFGAPIDLAFLDGMHLAEFLLRDFINTEKYCRQNSVIAMHDCLPGEYSITTRSAGDPLRNTGQHKDWWTGDVWKVVPILRAYRPDLHILVTDSQPTGLVIVSNLDPKSTVLQERYDEIVRKHVLNAGEADFVRMWEEVTITSADSLTQFVELSYHVSL